MRSRLAALLLLVMALLVGGAAGAPAHGDTGTMEVLLAEAPDGREARVEVGVLHLDGDPATEATVTVTLLSPEGGTVGPLTLETLSGARYGATVPVTGPGQWTLDVTATNPTASARQAFTVPESGVEAATTTTVAQPEASDARDDARDEAPEPILPDESESRWSAILLGVAVLVAAVVFGFWLAQRRR